MYTIAAGNGRSGQIGRNNCASGTLHPHDPPRIRGANATQEEPPMTAVKLTILFYSTYGTNHDMAECAAEAARAAGADIRLRRVRETAPQEVIDGQEKWRAQVTRMEDIALASPEDLEWADAFLFSAPTRFGAMPSQMQSFIDTLGPLWQKGALAGKAASGMSSTNTPHGGQETTLVHLYTTFMHWGAVIVPPGYTADAMFTLGNPYGTTALAGQVDADVRAAIGHQTRRLLDVAGQLAG